MVIYSSLNASDGSQLSQQSTSKTTKKTTVECPMCNKPFSIDEVQDHAFFCQGPVETRSRYV